jgi:hypothetical protein
MIQFFESGGGYSRCRNCGRGIVSDGPHDRCPACGSARGEPGSNLDGGGSRRSGFKRLWTIDDVSNRGSPADIRVDS